LDIADQKQRIEEIRIKEFHEEDDDGDLEALLDDLQSL